RQTTRHGRAVWYVRVAKGQRIRLRGEYGTPEFWAAYESAVAGKFASGDPVKFNAHSLGWLIERYRESRAWAKLSQATRAQRERALLGVAESAGKTFAPDSPGGDRARNRTSHSIRPQTFLAANARLFRVGCERKTRG